MMSRNPKGSLYQSKGSWFVSLSLKKRISIRLPTCTTLVEAEVRRAVLADIAARLKQGNRLDAGEAICRQAAAMAEESLPKVLSLVAGLVRGTEHLAAKVETVTTSGADITFGEFSKKWTSNSLAALYRRRIKAIDHTENILRFKKHIYPLVFRGRTIEATPLREFSLDHAEHVLRQPTLPEGSVRHVAQCLHRVLSLGVYPARILEHSPLPRGWLPPPNPLKARSYLFPDEEAAAMANTEVLLVRRVFIGVCGREGPRVSNVVRLKWDDLTLDVGPGRPGRAVIDRTKNGEPIHWVLDPGTTEALRRWKRLCPSKKWVFPAEAIPRHGRARSGQPMAIGSIAVHLRAALQGAGIVRPDLFNRSETRIRIRAQDVRATFITLALACGRSEDWVRTRTGHKSSQMIARYRREARTAQELELGWLHPLHECIPELAELGSSEAEPTVQLSPNCRPQPTPAVQSMWEMLN